MTACLRSLSTTQLQQELKSTSINLHGDSGLGRSRCLKDLSIALQAQGDKVVILSMQSFKDNYQNFLLSLADKLHELFADTDKPEIKTFPDVGIFLKQKLPNTRFVLILDNFDALLDKGLRIDAEYKAFFDELNGFRNLTHRRLILGSHDEYDDQRFYKDDAVVSLSKLELKKIKLHKLSENSLKQELLRRQLGLGDKELDLMAGVVYQQHPQSYAFLEFVCDKLPYSANKPLKKRLKLWQKEFQRDHKLTFREHLDHFKNALIVASKEIDGLKLAISLFIAAAVGLFGVLSGAFSALWNLFGR